MVRVFLFHQVGDSLGVFPLHQWYIVAEIWWCIMGEIWWSIVAEICWYIYVRELTAAKKGVKMAKMMAEKGV